MIRFYAPIIMISALMSMVACSGRDPVSDEANAVGAGPAEVDVLPADESAVTPTNELENGSAEPVNSTAGKIPASLHGRWGQTPGDCTSARGDAKGLIIVSADGIQFYESRARPAPQAEASANSISGEFAFTGEGMTWRKYQTLMLEEGKLVRTEGGPMASFTYARCGS